MGRELGVQSKFEVNWNARALEAAQLIFFEKKKTVIRTKLKATLHYFMISVL